MLPDSDRFLERELVRLGLLSAPLEEKLEIYIHELERWNQKINLTALRGEELVKRLIIEPVKIGQKLQMSGTLMDVGSGNGSPGIPLYLTCKLKTVHLVEARTRRAAFLRHVASLMDPPGIVVHRSRVQDLDVGFVDWISLQAVHPSAGLLKTLQKFGTETTRVVWITNVAIAPTARASRIDIAGERTAAWVFQLDQF